MSDQSSAPPPPPQAARPSLFSTLGNLMQNDAALLFACHLIVVLGSIFVLVPIASTSLRYSVYRGVLIVAIVSGFKQYINRSGVCVVCVLSKLDLKH
jgi:hypothetical protein